MQNALLESCKLQAVEGVGVAPEAIIQQYRGSNSVSA